MRSSTSWAKKLFGRAVLLVGGEKRGQILMSSEIGRWIYDLAVDGSVSSIVEIGAWKGLGSTKIISEAMAKRSQPCVAFSLEANEGFFRIAQNNLGRRAQVELIFGTIVSAEDLDTADLSLAEQGWLEQDLADLGRAPIVLDRLPEKIDLLILDGGEFSSWAEFETLEDRLRSYLVLDDVNVRKNKRVEAFVRGKAEWSLLAKGGDRNGWSIWERI